MAERYVASSGVGMQPLVCDKTDDGRVFVQSTYGGVELTKDAIKPLVKWLVAAPAVADAPSDDDTSENGGA